MNQWLDKHMGRVVLAPAVVLILIFSIFPLVASLLLAFSRVRFTGGSFAVRFVGWRNFDKLFFGSEQFHLLGTFGAISVLGWGFGLLCTAGLLWWMFRYIRARFTWVGFLGRAILFATALGLVWLFAATLLSQRPFGTIGTTLFYVFVGCGVQFFIGAALAYACSQKLRGSKASGYLFRADDDHAHWGWIYFSHAGGYHQGALLWALAMGGVGRFLLGGRPMGCAHLHYCGG